MTRRLLLAIRSAALARILVAGALTVTAAAQDSPYPDVTNTPRSFTNFNVEVVRGFVVRQSPSFEVFSVNAYESTIVRHTSLSGAAVDRWRTLANPVSIAFDGNDLLVVGQGTHAIARHDSATGAFKDVLMLRAEPADIVVDDETHHAFVSCMGDDSVVEINLTGGALSIVSIWKNDATNSFPVKRPRFLYLDKGGAGTSDNVVYVAPLISGNNTLLTRSALVTPKTVHDGNDATKFAVNPAFNGTGLPDYDLFRLNPSSGTVDKVLRKVGSILTAHGRNPLNGRYWMLNVDHKNLSAGLSEPALRGKFADNRLTIANSLPASGSLPGLPTSYIDVDDTTTGPPTTYTPDRSVSFPYALAFRSDGWGAIGSSTTPIVVLFIPSGRRQQDLKLANPGSIQGAVVRTVEFVGDNLLAYCQQTGNIAVFQVNPIIDTPISSMSLGNDLTPRAVQGGRAIWYDAVRSKDGRTSCNTCHPQGAADGLVWQIGNVPVDDKGPMVTQPLLGIEDTFPYHWRGERSLSDFNDAFPGLLGSASKLPPQQLALFEEFVFSLRQPANPYQDNDRRVKDALQPNPQGQGVVTTPLVGHATAGLTLYQTVGVDSIGSCVECHTFPTGSDGEFFPDHGQKICARSNFEVAHLNNQLRLVDQPIVDVLAQPSGSFASNLLGSGAANDGFNTNLFDFNDFFFRNAFEAASPGQGDQGVADMTAFVQLFDSGTAKSVHWAARLNSTTAGTVGPQVKLWLLDQAAKGWVGAIAVGTYPVGTPPVSTRVSWYYDASLSLWIPERTTFPNGTLAGTVWTKFLANHTSGLANSVILGVPPGNERMLGADFDNDGLDSEAESLHLTGPWVPDTDGDGWSDGYEVANGSDPLVANTPTDTTPPQLVNGSVQLDFVTTKVAKLLFRTNEPTTWKFTLSSSGYTSVVDSRLTADTLHSAVVQALHPSPDPVITPGSSLIVYTWSLELKDLQGNTTTINNNGSPSQPDITADSIFSGNMRVVGDLFLTGESRVGGTYSATGHVRLDKYEGLATPNPQSAWVPICQVLKQTPGTEDWELVPAADFVALGGLNTDFLITFNGVQLSYSQNVLPGPYLLLPPTSAAGTSVGSFQVLNLQPGQKVLFNVVCALNDQPTNPSFFATNAIFRFLFPAVPTALRNVQSSL